MWVSLRCSSPWHFFSFLFSQHKKDFKWKNTVSLLPSGCTSLSSFMKDGWPAFIPALMVIISLHVWHIPHATLLYWLHLFSFPFNAAFTHVSRVCQGFTNSRVNVKVYSVDFSTIPLLIYDRNKLCLRSITSIGSQCNVFSLQITIVMHANAAKSVG